MSALLSLSHFGVALGDRIILADLSLEVPARGLVTLVGPSGSGKSTLLRTVAGLNDAHPALSTWGTATFAGEPLFASSPARLGEPRPGIGVVMQHARFYLASIRENLVSALPDRGSLDRATQTERITLLLRRSGLEELVPKLEEDVASLPTHMQRRLAIVRALVPGPRLLFADEPTAGLEENDAVDLLALLCVESAARAVVMVTHNQRFARASRGTVVFVAGGRVLEVASSTEFFDAPATARAKEFVATGNCSEASPNARPEELDSSRPPPLPLPEAAATARSRFEGPRNFFWVQPGRLGGLPRPGVVYDLERDLEGLRRLGVTTLVTLEETLTVPVDALTACGIASRHFPVPDMGVPTLEAAAELAAEVRLWISRGAVVAMHCRAGLGRTGTTLAAQLVFEGESARGAIERVRRINPSCIQSDAQIEFLSLFEAHVRRREVGIGTQD